MDTLPNPTSAEVCKLPKLSVSDTAMDKKRRINPKAGSESLADKWAGRLQGWKPMSQGSPSLSQKCYLFPLPSLQTVISHQQWPHPVLTRLQNRIQNRKILTTVQHPFRDKFSSLLGSNFLLQEAIPDRPWNLWRASYPTTQLTTVSVLCQFWHLDNEQSLEWYHDVINSLDKYH